MNRLGWNVVRLGNMWTGWQPKDSKGFNDTYGKILEVMRYVFSRASSPIDKGDVGLMNQ